MPYIPIISNLQQTTTPVVQVDDGQQCSAGSIECTPCMLAPILLGILVLGIVFLVLANSLQGFTFKRKAKKSIQKPFDLTKH
jgi:hypothetical protein